jgi:hypothetical protein
MAFCSIGCSELPPHEIVDCGAYKLGGISAAAIVFCDAELPATAADWSTDTWYEDTVTADQLFRIAGIKGTVASPAAVEVPNPIACGPENILVGFNWTCTWQDANATGYSSTGPSNGNTQFYCDLNTQTTYLILYLCGSDEVMVITNPTNYRAALMVPDNDRALQMFEVTASAYIPVGDCIQKYPAPPTFFSTL